MKRITHFLSNFLLLSCTFICIFSCSDDEDCCTPMFTGSGDVWIVNEGNFLQGNASLDIYDSETETLNSSVFQTTNNRGLGDVFQSITFYDDKAYLIVNNSQRIEVLNEDDHTLIATISDGLASPRYGIALNDKLYVSDLFMRGIHVIDLQLNEVTGFINTGVAVEELVLHDNLIFASANDYLQPLNQVYVIDPSQEQVIDSVTVGLNPNSMVKDADEMIWVMCNGVFTDSVQIKQSLYRIDPVSRTVDKSFEFNDPFPQYPGRLVVNESNPTSIYMERPQGVLKLDINAAIIPVTPFISHIGNIYGLGVSPQSGHIYIGDPLDFASNGEISIYDNSATLISTFTTGFIPGRFYFR